MMAGAGVVWKTRGVVIRLTRNVEDLREGTMMIIEAGNPLDVSGLLQIRGPFIYFGGEAGPQFKFDASARSYSVTADAVQPVKPDIPIFESCNVMLLNHPQLKGQIGYFYGMDRQIPQVTVGNAPVTPAPTIDGLAVIVPEALGGS